LKKDAFEGNVEINSVAVVDRVVLETTTTATTL
jgi:hypothetical protein